MIRTESILWTECPVSGELGFIAAGMILGDDTGDDIVAAADGALLAHDIVEHVNGVHNIGSVADELQALGAVWHARGNLGDISRDRRYPSRDPYSVLAGDVGNQFRYWIMRGEVIPPLDIEIDEQCQYIADQCAELCEVDDYDDDMAAAERARIPEYVALAAQYLTLGYNRAAALYGCEVWHNTLFWNTADAVSEALERSADYFEGQYFTLTIDTDTGEVSMAPDWEDDDDYNGDDDDEL